MKDNTRATIEFAAPGDDDLNGKAARYEFRYSTMPIEDDDDFETATPVGGFPLPLDAGTNQEFIIPSLEIRDYYIAIKAYDEAGNISGFEDLLIHVMPDVVKVAELSDNRAEYDNAAKSIVGGCDINNDGYDDVIVGAPLDDASGADTGKAYVYLGTSGVIGGDTASADIVINGIDSHLSSNNDYFGNSVSCGDFNGDGFDDIVIGANLEDTNNGTIYSANSGAVYMFYGAENIAANIELNALDADVVFQGRPAANQFGRQIAMLGDINQDGKSDLGVLEPYGEYLLANEGIAYVFYGDDYLSGSVVYDSSADFIIIGEAANAYLTGIIPAGDIDGDGILDLALSIVNNPEDLLSVRPGSVYILLGKNGYDDVMHVETRADMIFRGEHNYAYLGGNLYSNLESAMSMNGDINSDGIDDLIISSPEFDVSGIADAGMVYVFFGRGNWDGVSSLSDADMNIAGRFAVDKFGTRVDANGDFNNDGIDDLLVTAPGFDNGLSRDRGGAFVFYGHSGINGSLTWQDADVIIGRSDGISHDVGFDDSIDVDYIGQSGGFVGDINNDGYDDLAIGSPYADLGGLRDVGALYIIR